MSASGRQTNAARIHLRHLVTVCKYSKIDITATTFIQLHDTLPATVEDAEDGKKVRRCHFYLLVQKAKEFRLNPQQQAEIRAATNYVFDQWPRFPNSVKDQIREEINRLLN